MFPLQRIIAAQMRANGEMQAQSLAKDAAAKQMDSTGRMVVTMKANPAGGPPLITVKDAPADLLNQTQESDVEQTYARPKIAVEDALRERGFQPDDPTKFADPSSVDSYGERYSARRKLGGGVITSALMAGVAGSRKDDELRKNRANQTAAENSTLYQKYVQPVTKEEQDLAQLGNARTGHALQANQQYLSTRDKLLDQKNIMQFSTPEEYADAAAQAMGSVGGLREGDRELFTTAYRTGRVSFLNERVKALAGDEGAKAIEGYDPKSVSQFIADQAGVDPSTLNEAETNRFVKIFAGQQAAKAKRQRDEESKLRAEERAEKREIRMAEIAQEVAAGRRDAVDARAEQRRFDKTTKLAGQYDTAIKDVRKVNDRLATIEALATTADGASDIALLYQYMKELDSDSVVRESEFKTASSIGSVYTRFQQGVTQALSGKRLTDENRKAIVAAARTLANAWAPKEKQIKKHYTDRAKREGVPPEDLGYDIGGNASVIETEIVNGRIQVKR